MSTTPTLRLRHVSHTEMFEARKSLDATLRKGQRVYVILRSVSQSGMLRRVSVVVNPKPTSYAGAREDIRDITSLVARALDWKIDRNGYIAVGGCGFSVATHVVGALSWALYGTEYVLVPETL